MVQRMNCTDMEIQQMYNLLQDLEISMSDSKQQHEEVARHRNLCKLFVPRDVIHFN